MRIKNFIANDMQEALREVRSLLGEDAIIISNEIIDGKVHIRAATDEFEEISFDEDENPQLDFRYFDDGALRESLDYHCVLELVKERILSRTREHGLDKAFSMLFDYQPLLNNRCNVKMFLGTPGSGKSTAIAKAATMIKLKGKTSCIISVDNIRAGANKQLEAFADILDTDFLFCKGEKSLYLTVEKAKNQFDYVLIDTPGINPFIQDDVNGLLPFVEAVKADKILALDASKNTNEAIDIAEIFVQLGARFLLPTRMDLTRRMGAILSVSNCCELSFCAASVSSSIAKGLASVDAKSLINLIL